MRLNDFCELIVDCPHSTDKDEGKGYPLIRTSNIGKGRLIFDNVHRVSENIYLRRNQRATPQEDDLILAREAMAGNVAIVTRGEKVCLGQRTVLIRPNKNKVNPRYLLYHLLAPEQQHELLKKANGATVAHVNMSDIRNLPVSIPKLEIQNKIGTILSLFDDKIELNNAINRNLEQQAQALFKSWFVDFEPFGGEMPYDWKLGTLGELVQIKTGVFSPQKNPSVLVEHYSIPALDNGCIPIFEKASNIKSNKYWVTSESILISKLNPMTKRIWRPNPTTKLAVCSTEFIVFEARNKVHRDFIYSFVDSINFSMFMRDNITGTTNSRQRVNPLRTLDFEVTIPTDSIISDFCHLITPMYDTVIKNRQESHKLAEIRDFILPRLMSGEIDVSDL